MSFLYLFIDEIEAPGWSLNPGRYVGVPEREQDNFDFKERLEELNEGLEVLNSEARELEEKIAENMSKLLENIFDEFFRPFDVPFGNLM